MVNTMRASMLALALATAPVSALMAAGERGAGVGATDTPRLGGAGLSTPGSVGPSGVVTPVRRGHTRKRRRHRYANQHRQRGWNRDRFGHRQHQQGAAEHPESCRGADEPEHNAGRPSHGGYVEHVGNRVGHRPLEPQAAPITATAIAVGAGQATWIGRCRRACARGVAAGS